MVQHINDLVTIAGQSIDRATLTGLKTASAKSGVSFQYLLAKAAQESSFKTDAQAQGSSASGLFQFTRGTWLEMVKRYGAQTGLGDLAQKITTGADGKVQVSDTATESQILALRDNPETSALMAAQYARDNAASLQDSLGRSADAGDLYLAHFLGPAGASLLLSTAADDPQKSAANLMPAAAKANPSVFYNTDGSARSAAEVVKLVETRFANQMSRYAGAATQLAAAVPVQPASPAPATASASVQTAKPSTDPGQMTVSWLMMEELAKLIAASPMTMPESPADTTLSANGLQGSDWAQVVSRTVTGSLAQGSSAAAPSQPPAQPPAPGEQASRAYDAVKSQVATVIARRRSDVT